MVTYIVCNEYITYIIQFVISNTSYNIMSEALNYNLFLYGDKILTIVYIIAYQNIFQSLRLFFFWGSNHKL